jgi:AcrR family transcriptional regulator
LTVSDLSDRRARKKAQTRAEIRRSAQRLFAEQGFDAVTIADVADAADVAVQTVFNHFATKEDLFFDGYTPWVEGPAEAVRSRPAGVPPLAALRTFTQALFSDVTARSDTWERRRYVHVLKGSPTLLAYELRLLERAETGLGRALTEAWTAIGEGSAADIRVSAALTAALWVAATRSLLRELRNAHAGDGDVAGVTATVEVLADAVFDRLEARLGGVPALPGLRSPQASRAG